MSASNFPVSPAAYRYWDSGLVFGLPAEGQLSSPTCGALPFRSGTGLCSPNCVRGEDWAFLYSLAVDMSYLPAWGVWPNYSASPGSPNFGRVTPDNHNGIVNFLSATQQASCFGSDANIDAGDAQEMNVGSGQSPYEVIDPWLRGLIKNPVSFASQKIRSNDPLLLQPLQTLFTDCQKMKCTISEGRTLSGSPYWDYTDVYYPTEGDNPEIITRDAHGMGISQMSYGPANDQENEMEAKVIYVMYCGVLSNGNWTNKYAAVCLPATATMTNNSGQSNGYADPAFFVGGAAVAELAFGACGLEMRPRHTEDESARSICQVYDGPYLVVYPTWLNDFET